MTDRWSANATRLAPETAEHALVDLGLGQRGRRTIAFFKKHLA
jgi:hypothetical protein